MLRDPTISKNSNERKKREEIYFRIFWFLLYGLYIETWTPEGHVCMFENLGKPFSAMVRQVKQKQTRNVELSDFSLNPYILYFWTWSIKNSPKCKKIFLITSLLF